MRPIWDQPDVAVALDERPGAGIPKTNQGPTTQLLALGRTCCVGAGDRGEDCGHARNGISLWPRNSSTPALVKRGPGLSVTLRVCGSTAPIILAPIQMVKAQKTL